MTRPTPSTPALTEAQVRAIVKDELGKNAWFHDAAHSADAARQAAQAARDEANR